MKILRTGAMALSALIVLAVGVSAAHAQGGGGGRRGQGGFGRMGGMMGGGLMMLARPDVQKELKMTEAQVTKVQEKQTASREEMRNLFQPGGGAPDPEEMRKKMTEFQEKQEKTVADILTADQMKRYKQLKYQQAGADAFDTKEVAAELKITDEQKKKLESLRNDERDKMQDMMQEMRNGGGGGDRQAMQKKMQEIRTKRTDAAMALLTDDQKKKWKEMTGEPFKFEQANRRGGGA